MIKQQPIILDSPIEFALVGPVGGRDRVLAKSANAGLDLLGISVDGETDGGHSDLLSTFFPNSRNLHVVSSGPVPDMHSDLDSRPSTLRLAWNGAASALQVNRIKRNFGLSLSDLLLALNDEDPEGVELAIAPVILSCVEANDRRLRLRRLVYAAVSLYGFLLIAAMMLALTIRLLGTGSGLR